MKIPITRRKFIVGTGALAASAIVPMQVSQAMNYFFAPAEPEKMPAVKCHENEYWGVRSAIVAVGESASRIVRGLDIRSDLPYFQCPEFILINEAKGYEYFLGISDRLKNLHWMILVVDSGDMDLSQSAISLLRVAKIAGVRVTTVVYSPSSQKPTDSGVADPIGSLPLNQFSDSTIIVPFETKSHYGKDELIQLAVEDLIAVFAKRGLIGVDFADFKGIFSNGRVFHFGSGTGSSHKESWDSALNSPLLSEEMILQANSMWIHMSHSCENNEIILLFDHLEQALNHETEILVCGGVDESLKDIVRLSLYVSI